ncbi:MAG: helix-turn-helix transcriptional regulator [Candidatus Omnitrophota bacterium]
MHRQSTKLSQEVKRMRAEKDFSLRKFAKKVGMSASYLSMWETGDIDKDPSKEKISKMEDVLDLPRGELMAFSNTGLNELAHTLFLRNNENAKKVRLFFEKGSEKSLPENVWASFISKF